MSRLPVLYNSMKAEGKQSLSILYLEIKNYNPGTRPLAPSQPPQLFIGVLTQFMTNGVEHIEAGGKKQILRYLHILLSS